LPNNNNIIRIDTFLISEQNTEVRSEKITDFYDFLDAMGCDYKKSVMEIEAELFKRFIGHYK